MMVKLAESIGRLELAGRDFAKLTAYTQRVSALLKSIEKNSDSRLALAAPNVAIATGASSRPLVAGNGEIVSCPKDAPEICFDQVPLCTPNGDVLVQSLNVKIKHGDNVLISGPNGCGKSSLFRLLGELWPLFGGRLIKPPSSKLFYIPQKPYLTLGTLRDQIIYPDTRLEMQNKGMTDEHLTEMLKVVELVYLKERGYFDMTLDWSEVLSGGEKQVRIHFPFFSLVKRGNTKLIFFLSARCHRTTHLPSTVVRHSGRVYECRGGRRRTARVQVHHTAIELFRLECHTPSQTIVSFPSVRTSVFGRRRLRVQPNFGLARLCDPRRRPKSVNTQMVVSMWTLF